MTLNQFQHLFISLFCFFFGTSLFSQHLISVSFIETATTNDLSIVSQITPEYNVDYYKVVYNTVDENGDPHIASGAVAIPQVATCDTLPLGLYCHGTVLRKFDVPSANNFEAIIPKIFASKGFIVAAPDYIGLGESSGIHPYVHAETEATASVDLLKATREFLTDSTSIRDNNQLFLTGYSQGGHAAMATHQYIQSNNIWEFNVVASAPCSGPYVMSGPQTDQIISGLPYSNPGYIAYLIIGYQRAYGNLYTNLSDIFQSPYDGYMPTYFDGQQNQFTVGDVNFVLPQIIRDFMDTTVYDNFVQDSNHPLRIAIADNDVYDWVPEAPVRMFYCTADEQVAYQNALYADSVMNENGAADVEAVQSGTGNHGDCVIPALSDAFDFFAPFVDQTCTTILNVQELSKAQANLYPNPANNGIRINSAKQGTFTIYNINGSRVFEGTLQPGSNAFSTNNLTAGWYAVQVNQSGRLATLPLIIQH